MSKKEKLSPLLKNKALTIFVYSCKAEQTTALDTERYSWEPSAT